MNKKIVHDGQTKWWRKTVTTVCGIELPKQHVQWPWFKKVNCPDCLSTNGGHQVGRPVIGMVK